MKRLILLMALVVAMAVLAPAAFADDTESGEEGDGAGVEMEEQKELSAAQQWKAQMIADYVGSIQTGNDEYVADETEVSVITALRTDPPSMGWGVLFRLQAYEAAGMEPAGFLMDEEGYALGKIRKLFLEGDYAELPYTNLGQLQKASNDKPEKPEKVMPEKAQKDKKDKKDKGQG